MSLPLRRMFRTSLFLTLLGTNAPLFAFQSLSTVPPEPQEPKIAAASAEAEQAMGSFRKPQNWQIELAAAEPDIANPVAFFVDNQGRLFVCETFRQGVAVTDNRSHDQKWLMADLAAKTVDDRIKYHRELLGPKADQFELSDDRIRLLKDKDGDGRYEEAVVFADHFNRLEDGTGAGVLVRGNDAYYTCIPKLWKLTDHDGDGKAEQRDVIYDGFGVRVAFRGHDMHGLIIGPDGRLYFSIGDRGYHLQTSQGIIANPESGAVFRCELDGSNLEVVATGLRNPQELAFDDHGNLFTGDNNSDSGDRARWVYIAEGGDTGWRMFYQYLSDRGPFNQERIWYPFDEQTPAYIVPPITNFADGPSGLAFYPGTGLGEAYRDTFFLCDFRGGPSNSGVRTFKVMPKGAFFELVESQEPIWNILATDVDFAPDGSVLVSDWVNGWEGEGKGRIYRFFDPRERESTVVQEVKKILAEGVKSYDDGKLALLLAHPDRRVRLEGQWELASRESIEGFATLLKDNSSAPLTRLHAVWGLGQIARVGANKKAEAAEALKQNLENEEPAV